VGRSRSEYRFNAILGRSRPEPRAALREASESQREDFEAYLSYHPCLAVAGRCLRPESLAVKLQGRERQPLHGPHHRRRRSGRSRAAPVLRGRRRSPRQVLRSIRRGSGS